MHQRFGLKGEECLVVGNDLQEDGAAARGAGIPVHIVTDCLIPHDLNLDDFSHSTLSELPNVL